MARDIPRTLPNRQKYSLKRETVTDDYSPGGKQDLVLLCNPDRDITITLPSRGASGQEINIKNLTTHTISVSGTIDDDTDGCVIDTQYECITLFRDDDSNWWIV